MTHRAKARRRNGSSRTRPNRAAPTGSARCREGLSIFAGSAGHSGQAIAHGWITLEPSAGFSFEPSPEPELKTRTKAPCCKLLRIGYHLTHSNLTSWQHSLAAPRPSSSPVSPGVRTSPSRPMNRSTLRAPWAPGQVPRQAPASWPW